ncbi:MAG: O-antigen ligase family protein [Gammaproteobacteria bacterium]|nr:O-antigen ligase family protein [Gammaproteobacteria bacterium]
MLQSASFENANLNSVGPIRIQRWISTFLLLFIAFSFLVPWIALSRAFFFAGVLPLIFWVCVKRDARAGISDRSGWFAIGFIGFVAVATFIPEGVITDRQFQVVRWAFSTAVFMLAVLAASERWLNQPLLFARIFMAVVIASGAEAFAYYLWHDMYPARLEGAGFMGHPILGPSALISVWAIGLTLFRLGENRERLDQVIMIVSFLVLFAVTIFSQSRGPLVALVAFFLICLLAVFWLESRGKRWHVGFWVFFGVMLFGAGSLFLFDDLVARMLGRGFSYRPEIWLAVFNNPPEIIWIGEGMGTDFRNSSAGKMLMADEGLSIKHPHNLFLSVFHYTGIIGLSLFTVLLIWILIRICRLTQGAGRQVRPFAFGLFVLPLMLNMTDGHRIVAPPSSDWMFSWLLLMFLIGLVRHFERQNA